MQNLNYKAVPISDVGDGGTGVVEAIVSVTGLKDNVNDIILPGAFQKSLSKRTPKGVWHHNIQESVAKTTEIKELAPGDPKLPKMLPNGEPWPENAGGLLVKMEFNLGTSRGRDAYADVKFFGTDQEWSIGYSVPTGGATIDKKTGTRLINSLDLFEYSPVLFGAMPNARTVSVKSAQEAHKVIVGLNTPEGLELKSFLDEIVADEVKAAKKKEEDEEDDPESADDEAADETDDPEAEDEEVVEDDEEVDTAKKKRKGKKSMQIDATGLDMLDRAVKSLSSLYDHLVSEVKEAAEGDEPEESEEESLAGLVEAAGLDAHDDAVAFDTAYADGDAEGMEESANAVLDAVEEARDSDDADTAALKRVTSYISAAFTNVEPSDEEPAEEKQFQTKKKFSKNERDKDAAKGAAMPDGSFPIENEADLKNAIKACGRAKDKEAAKKHIKKRAKALGLEDLIPADWDESKAGDVLSLDRKSLFAEFGIEV